MTSLAVTSVIGVDSFQPLSTTSPPPVTSSLHPAEASDSNFSNCFSPTSKFMRNTTEANTSDPTTASPPPLTPFPDLNLQTAALLARLKNPSLLSTEELQSATADAIAALSAWKSEWLNIDDTNRRERGIKPAAHTEIRPRSPNTVREEKNCFWEDWNEQKRLRAGIGDRGLHVAGRVEPFPAAEAGPSRAPVEVEAEGEGVTITRSSQTLTQGQANPSTCRRGQRAHKPRKLFGETSPVSRDQERGPHEGGKEKVEQRTPALAQPLPKQEATRAKPNTGLAGKRKHEDTNEEEEEKLAAELSRQRRTRVSSTTPAPLQQPRIKLKLILKPPKPARASRANPIALNNEQPPSTTHSMSRAATPTVMKKTICQAASSSTSAALSKSQPGGKRKCLDDNDDSEQALPRAKKMIVPDTNRAPSNTVAPISASFSPENDVKRARHSAIMRAVWVRRRAEGTGGLYGGKPCASTMEKWKRKMAKVGELEAEE